MTLDPADARRTRLLPPRPDTRALVPVVIAVSFLVTEGIAQAVTPFIRQDDWPFLLRAHTAGVMSTGYYASSEGRWLNTAWWALVGQYGNPTIAALTYAVGYAVLVAGMWRVVHRSGIRLAPAADALLGIVLFASCVWVQLLYWPGTLTPSVLVAAAAMWLLPWAARSLLRLTVWVVLGEIVAVLTYPPVGAVLLVFAVVSLRDAPWRRVLPVVGTWLAAFALGVGVAYTLNWIYNGHFGLELAPWRRPNPLSSLRAFEVNTRRWLDAAGSLWSSQWWVALVGLVATAAGWRDPTVRPRLQRLVAAFAVACGLDVVQTVVTGVVTEARGQLWTWLVAVLPIVVLFTRPQRAYAVLRVRRQLPVQRLATTLLAVLAVGGVLAWRADIGEHQAVRSQYAAIAAAATAHRLDGVAPTVVVYQDPALRHTRAGNIMASTLFFAVREDQGGVRARWCSGRVCRELADASGPVVPLGHVGLLRDVVGVVVPDPPGWI